MGRVTDAETSFDGDKSRHIAATGGRICGDMFLNPGGASALMDGMIWTLRGQTFAFSLIPR